MKFRTMQFMCFDNIEKLYDFVVDNPKLPKELMDKIMKTVIDLWKSTECEEECEEDDICSNLKLFQKNLINIKPNKAKKHLNIVKNAVLEELNNAMDEQDDETVYNAGNTLRNIRMQLELDLKMCYLLRDYSKK
jgi:hypothetical protein